MTAISTLQKWRKKGEDPPSWTVKAISPDGLVLLTRVHPGGKPREDRYVQDDELLLEWEPVSEA